MSLREDVRDHLFASGAAALSAHSRALLLALAALADSSPMNVTDVEVARLLGMSPDSVRRNIEGLEEAGVLTVQTTDVAADRTVSYTISVCF